MPNATINATTSLIPLCAALLGAACLEPQPGSPAERTTVQADVIEAQLAHAKSGPLGAAYDRAEFMDQRRQMMVSERLAVPSCPRPMVS